MPTPLQEHLIAVTRSSAANLEEAYRRLPDDKRHWSPGGSARTAADMIAECAIMNDVSDLVRTRQFPEGFDYSRFVAAKAAIAQDEAAMFAQFHAGVEKTVAAIPTVDEADLGIEIAMPWGPSTVLQVLAFPSWNMSYHEGQVNYIAATLGLDH